MGPCIRTGSEEENFDLYHCEDDGEGVKGKKGRLKISLKVKMFVGHNKILRMWAFPNLKN